MHSLDAQTDMDTNTSYKVSQVMYASVPTTEAVASTEVSYTIDPSQVRSGYELTDGQLATVTKTIVEGQNSTNILAFSIVMKKEELAGSATTAEAAADGTTGFRAMTELADSTLPVEGGDVPDIPHVPGYVPVDPGRNEPLKPVNPEDPSKGFIPPVPRNPGKIHLFLMYQLRMMVNQVSQALMISQVDQMVAVTTQVPTLQHNHL
ncbi:hypothetical protein ACTGWG_06785 [Streptococcus suis]